MSRTRATHRTLATHRTSATHRTARTGGGPPVPVAGPTITNVVASSITTTTASISWSLDMFATGYVEYGPTTAYGFETVHENSYNYDHHVQPISGLTAGTDYHFRVHSTGPQSNPRESISADQVFTTVAAPVGTGGNYPADTTLTYIATPTGVTMPGTGAWDTDPTFGTKVRRVGAGNVYHEYSKIAAWNCDQSILKLRGSMFLRMSDWTSVYTPWYRSDSWWSNTDPDLLYYGGPDTTNTLRSYRPSTGVDTFIRQFTGMGTFQPNGEGAISYDDRYFCFFTSQPGVVLYDRQTDTVRNRTMAAIGTVPNSVPNNWQVTPYGQVILNWESGGLYLLDNSLSLVRRLAVYGDHGDSGLDANGKEIWVNEHYANPQTGSDDGTYLWAFELSSTSANDRSLGTGIDSGYSHVSMRNIKRPGWAYVSGNLELSGGTWAGRDQVYAVKTDGSGTVEVFGHRHNQWPGPNDLPPYAVQVHACPSPNGDMVIGKSDWLDATTRTRSTPYAFVWRAS